MQRSTKNTQDPQITELCKNISTLQNDLHALADMVENIAGVNDDLPHRLQNGLDRTAKWARQAGESTLHQAEEGLKLARRQVKERPLATLATAVGLGLICGQLLSYRK